MKVCQLGLERTNASLVSSSRAWNDRPSSDVKTSGFSSEIEDFDLSVALCVWCLEQGGNVASKKYLTRLNLPETSFCGDWRSLFHTLQNFKKYRSYSVAENEANACKLILPTWRELRCGPKEECHPSIFLRFDFQSLTYYARTQARLSAVTSLIATDRHRGCNQECKQGKGNTPCLRTSETSSTPLRWPESLMNLQTFTRCQKPSSRSSFS